jgi:hypothetical protein
MKILRHAVPLLALALTFASTARAAGESPFQLSLFNPVQIVPESKSVSGVRLNLIYGKNQNMTGFDWGIANHTTGNESALQIGVVNIVEKDFTGWQDGAVNLTRGKFTGLQSGLYNESADMHGLAYGWVNRAKNMRGVQIGLVNLTETMHGLQIGVANYIQKGKIPLLPIVNWSFD